MSHRVGVHIVGETRSALGVHTSFLPGYVQAACDDCRWKGELHPRTRKGVVDREASGLAQKEAIEHQGGTLRVVIQKRRQYPKVSTLEMFPGAR